MINNYSISAYRIHFGINILLLGIVLLHAHTVSRRVDLYIYYYNITPPWGLLTVTAQVNSSALSNIKRL